MSLVYERTHAPGLLPGLTVNYVIYDRPDDYPDRVVVRRWVRWRGMMYPDQSVVVTHSLAEARRAIPPGLTRHRPARGSARAIVEVWA